MSQPAMRGPVFAGEELRRRKDFKAIVKGEFDRGGHKKPKSGTGRDVDRSMDKKRKNQSQAVKAKLNVAKQVR